MRIVTVGISVPHVGVPHAGGEYYLRHVLALVEAGHSVTVLVPATPENRAAAESAPQGVEVVVVEPAGRSTAFRDWVNRRFRPSRAPTAFARGIRRDVRARRAAALAQVFEFQWTQMGGVLTTLRRMSDASAPALLVSHDVMSQSMLRVRQQHTRLLRRRVLRLLRWWTTVRDERRQADTMDLVVTFSEKDRTLLRSMTSTRVEVLEPPLEPLGGASGRSPVPGEVLFVGAFDRHENAEGAAWLLREVWPKVLVEQPSARLRLVGAAPSPELREEASRAVGVEVTGYVDDLDESYRSAAVVVVPLLTGAGVKFKTVTALLWGVPVVSTGVGVEGIEGVDPAACAVADDASDFAGAVVAALGSAGTAVDAADGARSEVLERYGNLRFKERLGRIYADVAPTSRDDATEGSST